MMNYITLKNKKIEYELRRTAKRNINISIKNDKSIYVSAPKMVSVKEIERIIYSKQDWILKSILKTSNKICLCNTYTFDNNSHTYYLGEYKRIFCIASNANRLEILEDKIIFQVKEHHFDNCEYKNKIFNSLLKENLKCITTDMLSKYLKLVSKDISIFKIREMKSRWGTCVPSKKEILLNFNLIHCPLEAIEYVTLHEVAHLIHPNHSKAFYATIAKYMPNWNENRKKLRDYIIS